MSTQSAPIADDQIRVPRGLYSGILGVATLVGAFAGVGLLVVLDQSAAILPVLAAVALASFATFAPVILRVSDASFGTVVFGASVVRLLIACGAGVALSQATSLEPRPVWLAIIIAMGVVLVVETAAVVQVLTRLERARARARQRSSEIASA